MRRRNKHTGHSGHERWLVSYADFITLLFAFFVVMFASSQADKGKAKQVSDSVKRALEENQIVAAITGILGGAADDKGTGNAMIRGPGGTRHATSEVTKQEVIELLPSQQFLTDQLRNEIEAGKVTIQMSGRGLVVSLREAAFFAPGDDRIAPGASVSLGKIAEAIRQLPNPVRLEGHTDSVPIHNSRFRSNWELSAARAIAVLDMLTKEFGIPSSRLAVAGYAETAPADTNDTDEGRARNRRVDIVILNQNGLKGEPVPAKPSPIGPPVATAAH